MEVTTTLVSLSDLKKLLVSIGRDPQPVRIRYRALGQLWHPNFLQVLKVEQGKSVLFHDAIRKKFIALSDLTRIMQFELDRKLHSYEPNFHYQISDDDLNEDP